jgi:hypothetical protein
MNKEHIDRELYFEVLSNEELSTAFAEYLTWRNEGSIPEGIITRIRRQFENDNKCISGIRHFTEAFLYVYAIRFRTAS